ncbi:nuclease-related domain-containing protein [Nocardia stercoris]|uniref:NERD domain-containing protein n=1 Tax=Nocardia stercoris TaxID=2483361 RepID=A0A3M2L3C4_9NOCA|nr:nuclease-related domain-containing protein [Nocardia stercoris]RMI32202.1 NERD domain-containing protein [Nocardia stercoris]
MLVRVQNPAGTQAERVLIDWLRTWKGPGDPHGVTTVNTSLFFEDRLHRFDAVVWTPTGCVIIDAVTLTEAVDGEIEVPYDGPWRVGNRLVTLEGGSSRGPLEASRDHTYALQSWLAAHGLGQRVVQGVVLVVPQPGTSVRLRPLWSDPGFEVIVGNDPYALHQYLQAVASQGRAQWTINDVALAFRGLSILPLLPGPQDLVDEGFGGSIDATLWYGGPQQAQAEAYLEQLAYLEAERPRRPFEVASPWYAPWELYPRRAGEIQLGSGIMRVLLSAGMLVAAAWVLWFVISILMASSH